MKSSTRTRIHAAAAMLAASLPLATIGAAEELDWAALRACTDEAWAADVRGWSDYAFDRQVVLEDLDKKKDVTSRKERHFRLTPTAEGFDELLISEDGRPATESEVKKFRKKANFSKGYQSAEALELNNPLGENLVLLSVLHEQEYRLVGEEEVRGIPCRRVEFDARPELPGGGSTEEQMERAVQGTACLAIEGCHVVVLEFETVRAIKQGPTKIEYLKVKVENQPVEDGFAIRSLRAEFDFSALRKHVHRVSTYTYSNFERHER